MAVIGSTPFERSDEAEGFLSATVAAGRHSRSAASGAIA